NRKPTAVPTPFGPWKIRALRGRLADVNLTRVIRRMTVGVLFLTLASELACSRPPEPAQKAEPIGSTDPVNRTDNPPVETSPATRPSQTRRASVSVKMRGVALHGTG